MDSSDFIEIIDEIGKRLEGPARHVYELAVRQVYVDFIIATVCFVIAAIVAAFVIPKALKVRASLPQREYLQTDMWTQAPNWMFGSISSLFITIGTTVWFLSLIGSVLNPEWAAIKMIARSIVP